MLVALVVSSSPVLADDPTAPAPAFVTMDRQDATSRVGIEGTAEVLNSNFLTNMPPPNTSASGGRLDLGVMASGHVVGVIEDLPSCAELIDRVMGEADQVLRGFTG